MRLSISLLMTGTLALSACQSARSPACAGVDAGETSIPPLWQLTRPGTIIATLEGGRGRRVQNATIQLERVGTTDALRSDVSSGVYQITGVDPGEYSVEITAGTVQNWRGRVMVDAAPGDTTRLRLRESDLCTP
jgi:hypothetical protein